MFKAKYVAIAAAILWASAALWLLRMRSRTAYVAEPAISLSLKREGSALRLSWNPNGLRDANNVVLWITDGTKLTRMDLTKASLENGNILYTPLSDEVRFKLEALRTVASGSLHFVTDQRTTEKSKAATVESTPSRDGNSSTGALEIAPRFASPARRKTTIDFSGQRAIPGMDANVAWVSGPMLIRPPAVMITPLSEMGHLPSILGVPTEVPPPPEPVSTVTYAPAPQSRFGKLAKRAPGVKLLSAFGYKPLDEFTGPVPHREVQPEVPTFISEALTEERRVVLRVSIDKLGRVTDVEPLPPLPDHRLVGLAASAARHWEFEPARSKYGPVTSGLILTFTFRNPRLQSSK